MTTDTETTKMNGSAPALAKTTPPVKAVKPPKAPKAPKPKPEKVGKLEAIEIGTNYLLACLLCAATDETRYYLKGVYLHRTADRFVRAVATDGHRAIIVNLYRESEKKAGPAWLDDGIIVPGDQLAARLKMIDKEQKDTAFAGSVKIAYGKNQPRIEVSDAMGINVFRIQPIDGTFPDYERVTTANWSGLQVDRGDWKPTGFDPQYLKAVGEIAKRLDPEASVSCYDYASADGGEQPVLFTFSTVPNVTLFLMPKRVDPKMGEATRLMLAPSVRGSIAALRAHETRNREAAKDLKGTEKDAVLAKADDFAKRIKAILENAGAGAKALPAPKPDKAEAKPAAVNPPDVTASLKEQIKASGTAAVVIDKSKAKPKAAKKKKA
jgi:hypothetical protein